MDKPRRARNPEWGAVLTLEFLTILPAATLLFYAGVGAGGWLTVRYHMANAAMMGARAGALVMNQKGSGGPAIAKSTAQQFLSPGCGSPSVNASAGGNAVVVTIQCQYSQGAGAVAQRLGISLPALSARAAAPYMPPLRPR
jgi:hypothetical protein